MVKKYIGCDIMYMVISENPNLTEIVNCQMQIHVRTHKSLRKVQHLIPENTLMGIKDHVPGLLVGSREPNTGNEHSL